MEGEPQETLSWRKYAADTFAAQSWGLTVAAGLEVASGMSLEQIAKSRTMMVVVNAVVGRPYGKWRDFVLEKCGVDEASGMVRVLTAEALAMNSFYLPLYTGLNAVFNDADMDKVFASAVGGAVMGVVLARPYGWCLDKVRSVLGVTPGYLHKKM